MSGYQFSDYSLRPATKKDAEHCAGWIRLDDDHRFRVGPEFFVGQEPFAEKMVLEDKNGEPIFYFRIERALRVHIQFAPDKTHDERQRTIHGLFHGFTWLKERARKAGFREIIFESRVERLIHFCKKRFGFIGSSNEMVCSLTPISNQLAVEKAAHVEHQLS